MFIISNMYDNNRKNDNKNQRTTCGFAKLGGGVTTQIVAGAKTVSDNPNFVRLHPQQSRRTVVCKRRKCGRRTE